LVSNQLELFFSVWYIADPFARICALIAPRALYISQVFFHIFAGLKTVRYGLNIFLVLQQIFSRHCFNTDAMISRRQLRQYHKQVRQYN